MIPTTDAQNPRPARSPVVAFIAEEHRDALDLVALGVRGNLGLAALFTGDTDAAERAFREELMLCRELVVLPIAFEGLRGLAAIAAGHGDGQRAAALLAPWPLIATASAPMRSTPGSKQPSLRRRSHATGRKLGALLSATEAR
jgi:hypothetical protein